MTGKIWISDLRAFALDCLAADRYPQDVHTWTLFKCDVCGADTFTVTIEHHTGSKKGNFRGVIWGACEGCGRRRRLFRFTGQHREWLRDEEPACTCGSRAFAVGESERIEGDEGLAGFFDEGVVVGQCRRCGRNKAFVYTD
jgi:hypothetical protein